MRSQTQTVLTLFHTVEHIKTDESAYYKLITSFSTSFLHQAHFTKSLPSTKGEYYNTHIPADSEMRNDILAQTMITKGSRSTIALDGKSSAKLH
jgi:hypothetical protein